MTEQQQVNPEDVISILRSRLSEETYQRTLIEAAYAREREQHKTTVQQLQQANQKTEELSRQLTANQHTQLSQQLEHPVIPPSPKSLQDLPLSPRSPNNPDQPHEFEPGENPLRCKHCNYMKDAKRHTPVTP